MSKRRKYVLRSTKGGKSDPFADKEWLEHAQHFRTKVLPGITSSKHCLCLVPEDGSKLDVQFALQIGAMILMDKPIVLLVVNQRDVPPKLARVADKIIECNMETEAGQEAAKQRLVEYLNQ